MAWAVDTSVLVDVAAQDPVFAMASADLLAEHRDAGLLISPVTYVELAPVFRGSTQDADEFLAGMGVVCPQGWRVAETRSAFEAWYRAVLRKQQKQAAKRPVADVLIGAFALRHEGLLTRNSADFRTLFPTLKILEP